MKLRAIAMSLVVMGVMGMATNAVAAPRDDMSSADAVHRPPAPPKLKRTIDLGILGVGGPTVQKLSFSPDGRYLAIVESPTWMKTDIAVWDVQRNKEQSHIHCPYDYSDSFDDHLLWSADGKVISFGAIKQWDPMTGKALPDNPAIGRSARLNKDGSKMLTIVGEIGEPSYIHVYDTKTWALKKIYADGLEAPFAAWTADDKILVSAAVTTQTHGKTVDGRVLDWYDAAVRLLDPSGKEPTKAVWFPHKRTGDPTLPFRYDFPVGSAAETNFATNQIFLDSGGVIDGETLHIRRYHEFDKTNVAPGAFGMAFSQDGKWLYLKGATFAVPGKKTMENVVVDTASGEPILKFPGALGHLGDISASPDGSYLAVGDEHSVLLFSLR